MIGTRPNLLTIPRNGLVLRVEDAREMSRAWHTLATVEDLGSMHVFGDDADALWRWFREGHRLVQAAGGAVQDQAGRLLAIHRLGRWDLPKGKVEPGEELEAAAVREVQEECGLQRLKVLRPLCETWHTYPRNGERHLKCTHWFLMEGDAAEPLTAQAEEDIDAVRWVGPEDLVDLRSDTYASLLPVINAWEASCRDRG